jgi:hypothetical protein
MKESSLERKIGKYLALKGYLYIKLSGYKGIPDRLCISPTGLIFFIELKAKKGVSSDIQRYYIRNLKNRGVKCELINSFEAFLKFMEEING